MSWPCAKSAAGPRRTALAHAPSYVCGVINLRGAVLPVIDLAERLGLERSVPDAQHVIIVVQIGRNIVGMVVSAVCDILDVAERRNPADAGRGRK